MTQIDYAKKNSTTEAMQEVAAFEGLAVEIIKNLLAEGKIVIPHNVKRSHKACGIGHPLRTKVNANIGTSQHVNNLETEMEKLQSALKAGADAVMDLSTGKGYREILQHVLKNSEVMVGTVPLYGAVTGLQERGIRGLDFTADILFEEIEWQAACGVDFMTIHAGITSDILPLIEKKERLCGVVSRGGSLMVRWMQVHGKENPLFSQFERLLAICRKYDVTISLGDGLRPGAGEDANDNLQLSELEILGSLVTQARNANVQVMVEGPGHVPLSGIEDAVTTAMKNTDNAPLFVLGPLVTDSALGHDHIAAAIGAGLAVWKGASFICYVTPAEHLGLPGIDDVYRGTIASKIAAHAGDIARGNQMAILQDRKMSLARKKFDWTTQFDLAIDKSKCLERKDEIALISNGCSMCGDLCAMREDY